MQKLEATAFTIEMYRLVDELAPTLRLNLISIETAITGPAITAAHIITKGKMALLM